MLNLNIPFADTTPSHMHNGFSMVAQNGKTKQERVIKETKGSKSYRYCIAEINKKKKKKKGGRNFTLDKPMIPDLAALYTAFPG